jgi:2',3'-cyclic-nucleotide 2'-phosphodiesterase / 3'-nucleotidase
MKKIFFYLAAAMLIISCQQPATTVHVKVIAITDVHAVVFPYDFIKDTIMNGSLAHLKSYVDEQRAIDGQQVILLDNGDLLQGQPTGYWFNFASDRPRNLFADVLNEMGFDAASVGNHDIETGPEVYNRLKNEFRFPWLAANIIDAATGEPYFTPYTIINKQGVKVAVLGLITPGVPGWLPEKLWEGLEFTDMYEAAQYWSEYIHTHENPDILIGLFHAGAGEATEYTGRMDENASLMIAKNIPGFDIIFTGHDHRSRNVLVENVDGKEVLMMAGHSHGRSVAVVDLIFNRENKTYTLASREAEIVSMENYSPSGDFMSTFSDEFHQVKEFVTQPLGTLQTTMVSRDAFRGNAAFVDFIHQMQLDLTGADISLGAPLSFDATLQAGPVTMRDMFRLYPFENYLYVMELTGKEIKEALEHSYGNWFNTMRNANDHIFLMAKDQQGNIQTDQNGRARFARATFNFDSAAGIDYVVDVSKPAGNRITIRRMSSGAAFDEGKTYRVAVNSYRGSGGGGHLTQGAGIEHSALQDRIIWVSDNDLRSHIAQWIKQQQTLNPQAGNNWQVVPAQWTPAALDRDMRMVFLGN